jgi:hypothetical protein
MPPASPPSSSTPSATSTTAGAGCPAADHILIASYLSGDPASGAKSHTGWVLPLHDAAVDSVTGRPEYAPIDAATAAARGVPTAPTRVWLSVPGQPPCRATAGSYYAAAVDTPTPNVTYGVELSGCTAPPQDQQEDAEALALISDAPPSECEVLTPHPVASRVGETDAQKHWQRPTKETAIPAGLAAAIPPHDCRAPGCETLWAFGQIEIGGQPVAWAGAINWLTIPPGAAPETACDWKAETFAGFFVPGPDGRAAKITEGQDHPLLLTAVLADRSGSRALVAEGPGEYSVYDLRAGAKLARHLVWLRLAPETYALDDKLGPNCRAE